MGLLLSRPVIRCVVIIGLTVIAVDLFIDHLNDLPGILDALHPVGIAAGIVDLPQRPLLEFSQMTVRQFALHPDEAALVADDDIGNAGGAVRPSVFLPEENVLSQGRQVSLNGRDDVTFKQMNQLLCCRAWEETLS